MTHEEWLRHGEVIPNGDLREHVEGDECWCHPYIEDGVIIHNPMDGRVDYEEGRRKPN
jgi:hypothetical protein